MLEHGCVNPGYAANNLDLLSSHSRTRRASCVLGRHIAMPGPFALGLARSLDDTRQGVSVLVGSFMVVILRTGDVNVLSEIHG